MDSWISGFIDGEGCFLVYVSSSRRIVQCRFTLQVRADDAECLRSTQRYLGGIGRISTHHSPSARRSRPLTRWSITSKQDCAALVAHLERYPLLAKKRKDFEVWKRAVEALSEERNVVVMEQLRDELRDVRAYSV